MKEKPFEYMKRRANGMCYDTETVRNWYIARAYVLNRLSDVAFSPSEECYLQAVVYGDSSLMLATARQLALSAHYINFREYNGTGDNACRNRSIITLVSSKRKGTLLDELNDECCLGNLLKYCRYTFFDKEMKNEDSFIDIEFHFVRKYPEKPQVKDGDGFVDENGKKFVLVEITEDDVQKFVDSAGDGIFSIETNKAVLSSRVYKLGEAIENLPAENIHNALRYKQALDTFQYKLLKDDIAGLIECEKWKNLTRVTDGLSNIFCTDCFESREKSVLRYQEESGKPKNDAWKECNEPLSRSEHNRWVVEKLILGFDILSDEQRVKYERLFENDKSAYASALKKDIKHPSHIDICSCHNLRRIDPNNLKYDSFLMLSIDLILQKTRKTR